MILLLPTKVSSTIVALIISRSVLLLICSHFISHQHKTKATGHRQGLPFWPEFEYIADRRRRRKDITMDATKGNINGSGTFAPQLKDVEVKTMVERTSQELMQLTHEERMKLQEEIHGASSMAIPENPELLQRSIHAFAREIDAIPDHDPVKNAFNRAVHTIQSRYVVDHRLWLKFLRATFFEPAAATRRFMEFLDLMSSYFGDDALLRPVRFADLTVLEEKLFREGETQILNGRDPLGRRSMTHVGGFITDATYTAANRTRIALYNTCK